MFRVIDNPSGKKLRFFDSSPCRGALAQPLASPKGEGIGRRPLKILH